MHFTVHELDISKYKNITAQTPEVVGGSRPRLTLVHKNGGKFFFKTYTKNPREIWAECLASHIAELVDIPAQSVTIKYPQERLKNALKRIYPKQLPKDWKPIGTLSRNIFPKRVEIIYGMNILGSASKPKTLEEVEKSISQRYYAPEDLLQAFSDMLVLDIFLGNMDRHHENWGICEDNKYKQQVMFDKKKVVGYRYFTPLFDHGSSLMFELSDKQIIDMVNDENKIRNYVENSKFGFILDIDGKKNNVFNIVENHLKDKTVWGERLRKSLHKFVQIDMLQVASLVIKMPSIDILEYSSVRRKILYKSLIMRYNKIRKLDERC